MILITGGSNKKPALDQRWFFGFSEKTASFL